MPTFTLGDVGKVIKDRCAGSAPFAAAVPGGSWYGRGPDAPDAYPYAVFQLDPGGVVTRNSDGTCTQRYTLRMGAYVLTGGDPDGVQAAMDDALTDNPDLWAPLPAGAVVHCLAEPYDGKFKPELRQAADVFLVGGQWAMLLEQGAVP